jgi:hypothetical protein
MEHETRYFSEAGRTNTDAVLQLVAARARDLGIRTILVPSTTGVTALAAAEALAGLRIIVMTHEAGFAKDGEQEFPLETRQALEAKGIAVHTVTHAFGGLSYAMKDMYGTATLGVDMGNTLRTLGQGMKVVIECPMAAMDAGLLKWGEEIISMGGTNRGVDTAVTLKPVHVKDFFSLRINEILCKPRFDG